jgi:hypothetical protein
MMSLWIERVGTLTLSYALQLAQWHILLLQFFPPMYEPLQRPSRLAPDGTQLPS